MWSHSIIRRINLFQQYRLNKLLAEFSRTAGECETPLDVFEEMNSLLARLLDFDRISIRFVDPDTVTIRDEFVGGIPVQGFARNSTHLLSGTVTADVMSSGKPLIISNCGDESALALYPNLKTSGEALPSLLSVPLIYRGRSVGSMQLRSRRKGAFSAGHAGLVQTAAAHITPTVVNAHQLARLQREVQERDALAEIGRAASATIDFGQVWEQFVSSVKSLVPCDRLVVALMAEDSESLTDRYVYGIPLPDFDDRPTRTLDGLLPQQTILERRAEISSTKANDEFSLRVMGYKISERTGLRSAMFAPLIAGDRAIGTLNVRSVQPDAYSAQDLELFERLAMQIGGSVGAAEYHSRTVRLAAEKTARAELELENEKLAETNKTKSRFISRMSHELRTPLTSIMAFTDIVRRDRSNSLSEKDRKHLDVIKRNGQRLKEMIDDLLELSNFETGDLQVGKSEFILQDSINRVTTTVRPMIEVRSQRLITNSPGEEIRLVSDRDRIEQILSNLVSNACKYSGEYSEIRLVVTVSDETVSIAVVDSGAGIDEHEMPALFSEFSRLDNEVTRTVPGTGLGLAISRKLARALGGDVEVSSKKGEGSVFVLTLPVEMPLAA